MPELPHVSGWVYATLAAAFVVAVLVALVVIGGEVQERSRRRHRDEMMAAGLRTAMDDTGAYRMVPPGNRGHFHNGRTYVRTSHMPDRSASTGDYHRWSGHAWTSEHGSIDHGRRL